MSAQSTWKKSTASMLKIWRLVAERQTDALASLDRFVLHACELGLGQDTTTDLRRGRVSLSESLGIILGEIAHAERHLGSPLDR